MDRLEAKEYLQAASLGCLDRPEFDEFRELLEFDSELQFELAAYQTLCAMIPLSLEIVNPGEIIKDNVALRLIKIEEELRAKREAELKAQMPEVKIEDTLEFNQEIQSSETPTEDLTEELADESIVQSWEEQVEIDTPEVLEAPIPESYLAEDISKTEDIPDMPTEEEIFETEIDKPNTEAIVNENVEDKFEDIVTPELAKEELSERIEDIKYEQPRHPEVKTVVESYSGQVKVEHQANTESKISDITSRTVAERLQKSFQMDIEAIKRSVEKSESKFFKGIISLIIISAILLAVLIFFFFKFTADIKKLEQEIDKFKKSDSVGSNYEIKKDYSLLL